MENLTDALKSYDLRDYMLLKSRKPGPRAKHTDLPAIAYSSERKGHGYPILNTVTSFTFKVTEIGMIARMVHGDFKAHMVQKEAERADRALRARCKLVKEAKLTYHKDKVEVTTGAIAVRHRKGTYSICEARSLLTKY